MYELDKNVSIGSGYRIGNFACIGLGDEKLKLVIGDNACISSGAVIYFGSKIGDNFWLGHNSIIRSPVNIGHDVFINNLCIVDHNVTIGNNSRTSAGVYIDGADIGESVFIGPGTQFTDCFHPYGCPSYDKCKGKTIVGDWVVIGANCTVLPQVRIGRGAVIGAGSVITKDIPENAVAYGNPIKIWGSVKDLKCKKGLEIPYSWRK